VLSIGPAGPVLSVGSAGSALSAGDQDSLARAGLLRFDVGARRAAFADRHSGPGSASC
jgi:hypothetical protein